PRFRGLLLRLRDHLVQRRHTLVSPSRAHSTRRHCGLRRLLLLALARVVLVRPDRAGERFPVAGLLAAQVHGAPELPLTALAPVDEHLARPLVDRVGPLAPRVLVLAGHGGVAVLVSVAVTVALRAPLGIPRLLIREEMAEPQVAVAAGRAREFVAPVVVR